jgi:DNA topoisomerase-1
VLSRIRELAIPPAWRDVWICADPAGHLQATGIDAAGRKQYLYHPIWNRRRDREKFQRMVGFARSLSRLRRLVASDLHGAEPTRERVLACAVRLLDVGLFRIGGEEYAEDRGGLGLATISRRDVSLTDHTMVFDYPAKSGVRRVHTIEDPRSFELVQLLKRRAGGGSQLLAYRENGRWNPVRSDEINEYLKLHVGEEYSAKDFRTWSATLVAAVAVAAKSDRAASATARRRVMDEAVRGVAELLGNTPAVARRAYIDPRVFDRYLSGATIAPTLRRMGDIDWVADKARLRLERALLKLLTD